jgi:hypothetical protein
MYTRLYTWKQTYKQQHKQAYKLTLFHIMVPSVEGKKVQYGTKEGFGHDAELKKGSDFWNEI